MRTSILLLGIAAILLDICVVILGLAVRRINRVNLEVLETLLEILGKEK